VTQQTPSAPRRCWAEMEGSVAGPLKFKSQDYEALRGACLQSGSLFSDPLFPADQGSIGMPPDPDPAKAVKWLRPKDISANAMFVEGTTSTTDICQGQLGNCWFLAALSCLTMHPTVFVKVVPLDQSMTESYAGIFRFRFWQYGEWVEVVVDDSLPVCEGRLLFSYSCTKNEFWSALVEKAYAKLNGSYGSLKGGNISEGMEDFTGGIAYTLSISSRPPQILWKLLNAALSRGSLLSCFIQAKTTAEIGQQTSDGLVRGHAYAITDMDKVKRESEEVLLLRLRNPWGFVEYTGPWSDKSKNWDKIDKAEKKRIKLKLQEDGEFWIGVEDFCKLFNTVELCSVNPDSMSEDSTDSSSSWSLTSYKGSWVPGCSAGGNRSYPRKILCNDEDDGKRCTALVELLQRDRRQKNRINFLYVAFHIFRIQDNPAALNQSFFSSSRAVGRSGKYQAVRGVWRRVLLEPVNVLNTKIFKFVLCPCTSVLENDYQLPLETCRQLIFTEDTGGRGRLNRTQAEQLVSAVRSLQSLFVKYDEDSSGSMSPFELTKALEAAGVQCDGEIVQVLWERFGSGELHLPFHAYVSCVTRLKMLHDLYESESSLEVKNRGINAVSLASS
uniref:Calpain 8 n=1 Tax=Denticeps clupeoides TaxID=299321 RepID=A0AAY4E855_9TELE